MKKLILLSLLLLTSHQIIAQQYMVTGKVVDTELQPMAYVNVLILQAADSTLVKGAVSDEDGAYIFKAVKTGDYVIKASFVGYAETFSDSFTVDADKQIKAIAMDQSAESLETVKVLSQKPTIQRKVDRLVFNVENTVVSSGNTFDILKRTPGVIVSQGQIMVRNNPAQVYINNRKVYLTSTELQQLLEGFSGENVKSVEVITTPPAKYDAEGGAILNITTSKNLSIGYKGSITGSNTVAIVPKYTLGTSQYYKNDWLNAYVGYTFNSRDDYKNDDDKVRFFDSDNNESSIWLTDFRRKTHTLSHSLNTILDFLLDEKNTLSLSANLLLTPTEDSDISGLTNIYNPQNSLDSLYTTNSNRTNDRDNLLFNLDYTRQLGENGATFSAKANYIHYNDHQQQDVATYYRLPNGTLINTNFFKTFPSQKTDIYTGQADYSGNLGTMEFEAGAKYSGIDSRSSQDYFDTGVEPSRLISNLSDTFNYNENIYAGYASFNKNWEKWSTKLGLRGEYTHAEGNSITLGKVNTQSYFELFPTFYLLYNASDSHAFSATYSRRIDRPRFQSLNPFRTFLNENNFLTGNPNIQPAITNKIGINYNYKNQWSFDLYWEKTNNAMAILPFQDNEQRIFRSQTTNLNFEQQFSLDISYFKFIKDWWQLYTLTSIFDMKSEFLAQESDNVAITTKAFGYFNQLYNAFDLDTERTFQLTLSTYFLSNLVSGSYLFDRPQFGLTIGLQKSFFNGRLTATIDAEDLTNTMNIPRYSRYLNQDNSFFAKAESRRIRFGLLYKLGNFKLKDNQRPADAEEANRIKALNVE